jgi:hypothetical protein
VRKLSRLILAVDVESNMEHQRGRYDNGAEIRLVLGGVWGGKDKENGEMTEIKETISISIRSILVLTERTDCNLVPIWLRCRGRGEHVS